MQVCSGTAHSVSRGTTTCPIYCTGAVLQKEVVRQKKRGMVGVCVEEELWKLKRVGRCAQGGLESFQQSTSRRQGLKIRTRVKEMSLNRTR